MNLMTIFFRVVFEFFAIRETFCCKSTLNSPIFHIFREFPFQSNDRPQIKKKI